MRISNIELLRALAATLVLFAHVSEEILASGGSGGFYEYFRAIGSSGVDLFFVISGFVITTSFWNKPRNSWAFFRARVRRVVPAYWILTTLVIVALLLALRFGIPTALPRPTLATSIESYFFVSKDFGHQYPVLAQGWTLEYEMLFYVVFTLAIFARKRIALIASIAVLVLGLVLGYGWLVSEFVMGVGVAAICFHREGKLAKPVLWLLLAVGVAALALSRFYPDPSGWRVLAWGVPAVAILFACVRLPQLRSRLVLTAGRISYPVYLIQWFVNPVVCLVAVRLGVIQTLSALVVLVAFVVTQVLAFGFDRWVDQPIKRNLIKVGF